MVSPLAFKQTDTILRVLPATLLLLFVAAEFRDPLTLEFKLNATELFLLIAVISYPLGMLLEQFGLTVKNAIPKRTRLADDAELSRYLHCDREGFWQMYLQLHSVAKPEFIRVVEQNNLKRFFFMNMATATIAAFIVHIAVTQQMVSALSIFLLVLTIVLVIYHFRIQHDYFYILSRAIKTMGLSPHSHVTAPPPPPKPEDDIV
jgi:hypothetical protein